ncbi:MAG: PEP-CTERM-box response regulator transcription factor [Desulfomicrobium sp.]|nr:PEP-CTERM-box response regulator transcription factor [Pseudomonadota bacterium]MBV1711363.1 PEP-CTERM-box response regulator transcription factor [Desulfomicrobium sp.]MBU4570765.1 PEP-CTERM-box response regulator transcription factor [Pseudomonadota bacterium]MBU4595254.1 PEP-CTERM-box response regulator transcription factor [Pseudomonadota bacterium]MBV1720687.1 PEP-CTERM-box response regulator transcription factor [Desulfomicrobium sp.]
MEHLLIVDDNEDVLTQLKWGLTSESYTLHLAANVDEALVLFRKLLPGVVTLDLGLPPHVESSEEGFRGLVEMLKLEPSAKIIVVTGNDERENALQAIKLGAFDFFRKPIDLDELRVIIRRAFHLHAIERETVVQQDEAAYEVRDNSGIVGACAAMRGVLGLIDKVAASDVPILISGESGTGKELVARAIHSKSLRKHGPMICINCGAIPENLIESELFGHEKGAFTGAASMVRGKVEYASDGTLFLDEIGELPVNLQVKLLRFLQEMVIQRVGGRKDIPVNVRIIAATNIDIAAAIAEGRFREDLYYRIGVVNIHLPPLREREDDVRILAEYFLDRIARDQGKTLAGFTPDALACLNTYGWPGNIRELENKLRRAVLLADSTLLTSEELGFAESACALSGLGLADKTLKEARAMLEKKMVLAALAKYEGNIVKASEALGISRPTMYDLLKKHEIEN